MKNLILAACARNASVEPIMVMPGRAHISLF